MNLHENELSYKLQERPDTEELEPLDIRDLYLMLFFGVVFILAAFVFTKVLSM